jgi:hypothetical protein
MLYELLTEVPILPLFSEFETLEINDDVVITPYSISSMSYDNSVLEEIIYERINNGYKVIKPKSHTSVYNAVIDLKKSKLHVFNALS